MLVRWQALQHITNQAFQYHPGRILPERVPVVFHGDNSGGNSANILLVPAVPLFIVTDIAQRIVPAGGAQTVGQVDFPDRVAVPLQDRARLLPQRTLGVGDNQAFTGLEDVREHIAPRFAST